MLLSSLISSDVVVAILSAAGTLAGVYMKYYLDRRKKALEDPILEAQEVDMQVMNRLHDMVDRLDCDRAYIIEFHNGGKFFSGRSMQKFSMTYEVVRPGVSHEQQNYQNVLISVYMDYINGAVANNDYIIVHDSSKLDDHWMKTELESKGIESMVTKIIRSLDNRIVGVLIINYVKHKANIGDSEIAYISQTSDILAGYLL